MRVVERCWKAECKGDGGCRTSLGKAVPSQALDQVVVLLIVFQGHSALLAQLSLASHPSLGATVLLFLALVYCTFCQGVQVVWMLCFTELVDLKLWSILGFPLGKYGVQSGYTRLSRISRLWVEEVPRTLIMVLALIMTAILGGLAFTFLAEGQSPCGGCFTALPANSRC